MVDEKKLKKLSRLELLELLFEVSKENEQLREENSELKHLLQNKGADAETVDSLVTNIRTLEDAIKEIKEITVNYRHSPEVSHAREIPLCAEVSAMISEKENPLSEADKRLFYRLLDFFEQKTFVTCIMDEDLKRELTDRISGK